MPDPEEHAEDRGRIETILSKIPGFSGYLRRESRRDSDQLLRQWMADRLQRDKRGLDQYSRALAEAAKIDALPQIDGLRGRLDALIARLRGAPAGYSGFFDLVQVDEDVLEDIYEHDLETMELTDQLAQRLQTVGSRQPEPSEVIAELREKLDALQRRTDRREDILRGLEPDA